MTVILPFGRTVTRQFLPRSNQLLTRLASTNPLARVSYSNADDQSRLRSCNTQTTLSSISYSIRSYATDAASKPVGRPKAHTGRTAAKKSAPKAKTSATKKKAAKKPAVKRKPKTKAKAKAKPKRVAKRAATSPSAITRARRAKDRDLKSKALLTEPKQLPANAWTLYFSESKKGVKSVAEAQESTREAARNYKQLTPEEHERLNHTANENKRQNELEYKRWVSQHTPSEIKEANNARKTINKERKAKEGKKQAPIRLIKDDRRVKQPRNAYALFTQSRFASGDFKHMALGESARLIGREWKALSAADRKPFEDESKADLNRYNEEATSVYGVQPISSKKT